MPASSAARPRSDADSLVDIAVRAESLATRYAADRANRALLQRALATADSALRLDPRSTRAYAARAAAFAAAGRPRDAAADYRRLLALDSEYPRAANAAVGQFWRAGHYAEAYRWGKRQAEREPANLSVLFNFQVAAGFLVERARAESLMVRALELNPRYATAHGELAFLSMYAGNFGDAVRHMEAALALDSTSALQRGGLAQMLVAAGQPARARELLSPIVDRDSTATAYGGRSVLLIYAWALFASADPTNGARAAERALAQLRRRQAAGETTYQLYRELAALHAIRGQRDSAVAALASSADAGMHTYASWELSDPMFASIQSDPGVEAVVARMRADTRRQRRNAGLE